MTQSYPLLPDYILRQFEDIVDEYTMALLRDLTDDTLLKAHDALVEGVVDPTITDEDQQLAHIMRIQPVHLACVLFLIEMIKHSKAALMAEEAVPGCLMRTVSGTLALMYAKGREDERNAQTYGDALQD